MAKAVVFYSLDGSTRAVAKGIAKKYSADSFELEEAKQRNRGSKSFMKAGFQAFFGIKTKLKNDFYGELKSCDTIYIGTPIWAGKAAPAVNKFVAGLEAKGKSIYVFTLQASDVVAYPCKGAIKLVKKLEAKDAQSVKAVSYRGAGVNETISSEQAAKLVDESL